MKLKGIALLSIIIGITYFYFNNTNSPVSSSDENANDKLNEMARPSDFWEDRWSYPASTPQSKNFLLSAEIAKKSIAQASLSKTGLNANWRMEGPTNIGGRTNCLLVDKRDTTIMYAGMATGGIFKTTNGGANWFPIADDFPFLSISDIIQDPLYPDTLFAATGDNNFGSWGRVGDGVKVSYDAGTSWQSLGLDSAGVVSKLIIDSTNRILWAAVLGNPRINGMQRGVYKSTNMGVSWQNVHFVNDSAGAIDMIMDPTNPQILYVSYFNRKRTSTRNSAAGNDGRIWKTKDGGQSWTMLGGGLPNFPVSRIGLAISQQNPAKLYAAVTSSTYYHEGLYLSIDTGNTWTKQAALNLPSDFNGGFGWYFGQVRVNPLNDNEVWMLGVDIYASSNSGVSFTQAAPRWFTYEVHADKHDLTFYKPGGILLATDGGIYKGNGLLNSNAANWYDIDLIPNNQFYRIAINPHESEIYAGGLQDNGTTEGSHAQLANWSRVFGGDGFQMIYDPVDTNVFYCETQFGNLYAFDTLNLVYNYDFDQGVSSNRNWDMPFIMSRFNRKKLYCISDKVYITTNGPNGSFLPVHTGILNTGTSILFNSFGSALCEAKMDSNMLYAGTGDGKVWRINPSTGIKFDITSGLPNRYVTAITTSATDSAMVIVTHSGYLDFQNTPHIHISTDFGRRWVAINGNLPPFALNDVEILENTNDSVIFVASDVGVYVTYDQGTNWLRVGGNMPMIPVNDIAIDYPANRLIAGTFARSMQSFDIDSIVTPLVTGSREIYVEDQLNIYPNPARDFVNINSGDLNINSVNVLSLNGKLVQQIRGFNGKQRIDVSQMESGIYLLDLDYGDVRLVKKLVIK